MIMIMMTTINTAVVMPQTNHMILVTFPSFDSGSSPTALSSTTTILDHLTRSAHDEFFSATGIMMYERLLVSCVISMRRAFAAASNNPLKLR